MKSLIPLLVLAALPAFATDTQPAATASAVAVPWSPMTPKSPAAQRYMKWQNRGMILRQYEGVAEALRLTPQETEKLYQVLADQMTSGRTVPRMALNDIAAIRKQAEQIQASTDAEIVKVIGQNRMPLWKDFQQSIPFRMQVQGVRDQLQQMGVPLSDEQRQQLLDIFLQDRQSPYGPQLDESASLSLEERIAQSNKWQEESERKMLERMKPVLTAEQSARYSDFQAYMAEMRAGMQTFRQSGQGGTVVNGVVSGGVIQQGAGGGNAVQFRSMLMPAPGIVAEQVSPPVPASPPANAASK
jgi:hypothetical protein